MSWVLGVGALSPAICFIPSLMSSERVVDEQVFRFIELSLKFAKSRRH